MYAGIAFDILLDKTIVISTIRKSGLAGMCLVLLILAGCGGPRATSPKTYVVTGSVRYKNGTPLKEGMVQFHSTTGLTFTITGEIHDGAFALFTLLEGGKRKPGAIPDTYRVIVVPRGENQIVEQVKPTPEIVTVEAKDKSHFEIMVEKISPSR
jgi:hypothetical protein